MQINKTKLDMSFIKRWSQFGIDPIVLSILYRRGYTDEMNLVRLLEPNFETEINPFAFSQIIVAYKRLEQAIINNEKIIIYGDKDVDGTTSVAIMTSWLENIIKAYHSEASFEWDVPTGSNQYGLLADKINTWAGKYNLCITVDCGVTNINEIDLLSSYNIDCIVIDHHESLEILPKCAAIVNPMCEADFRQRKIAACMVTLLFIIGFAFYKSRYYDKRVGVFYTKDNRLCYDIYTNMILTDRIVYDRLSQAECNKADYNFFYSEKNAFAKVVSDFFAANRIVPVIGEQLFGKQTMQLNPSKSYLSNLAAVKYIYADIPTISDICGRYIPLATLGTIADVMPLSGINRAIVSLGLKLMRQGALKNIADMVKRAELDLATLSSRDLAWAICPLLNASGRMGDATITVYFLRDSANAGFYLDAIFDNNKERKNQEELAAKMFKRQFEQNKDKYRDIAFFYSDKIHKGITGIVAAHLAEYTKVPTIVAAKDGDLYVGSVRGKSDTSFVDFLSGGADLLADFGGHHAAAGFSLPQANLESFGEFVYENGCELKMEETQTVYDIDAEVPAEYLNLDLFKKVALLEPCGQDNESPLLYTPRLQVTSYSVMGKDKTHLKVYFMLGDTQIVGVFWSKAQWFAQIHNPDNKYNVLYRLEINKFKGTITPQLTIEDMEVAR